MKQEFENAILLNLGLASEGDKERMKRCRVVIKDNRLKGELIIK